MTQHKLNINSATIAYFSGTGGTKMAAECFESQLANRGITVNMIKISARTPGEAVETDLLILLSPVYAFRLAEVAEKWVERLPQSVKKPITAVISVSAGGEHSPNSACRVSCKRILEKKGYAVLYEKMLIMPSNFAEPTPPELVCGLIQILPKKVEQILHDILSGRKNITHPQAKDRLIASFGRMEHLGASVFGASIRSSDACNQCGLCIRSCPMGNIHMQNEKPAFGRNCLWCMKCIYACPQKALSPKRMKSSVIKEGFDISQMTKDAMEGGEKLHAPAEDDNSWKGVREYLEESL